MGHVCSTPMCEKEFDGTQPWQRGAITPNKSGRKTLSSTYGKQIIGFSEQVFVNEYPSKQVKVIIELRQDLLEDFKFGIGTRQDTAQCPDDFERAYEFLTFSKGAKVNDAKVFQININFEEPSSPMAM